MRVRSWLAISALLVGGCFDEGGGDAAQAKTIETLVQGLIAFGDIQSNIQTDPGAAGVALLEFIKWPVAADSLLSPPFEGAAAVMNESSARLAPALPVPDCLLQVGEPACEMYSTSDVCEAGPFEFVGLMNRKCADCNDPRGLCSYAWIIPSLKYNAQGWIIDVATTGSWVGSTSQIRPNLSARYDLILEDELGRGKGGSITACACTVFTVVDSPTESRKPRKLVNSSFVVRTFAQSRTEQCALVEFDGNGAPSVSRKCTCPNGNVCEGADPEPAYGVSCGNGTCEALKMETPATCPVDCPLNEPECGNAVCEIGETPESCPADCD